MDIRTWAAAARLRPWFVAASAAMLLAACGGGDGDAATQLSPGGAVVQGTWVLTVDIDNTTSAPVDVAPEDVPDEDDVAGLDTAAVARLTATARFQGYTVTLNGNRIRVFDPDTDFTLTINSIGTSGFQGCGDCGVGSEVSFAVTVNFTEGGLLDGTSVPQNNDSFVMRLRYRRTA